jgi:6-phosphogluconolactonase
MCSLLAAASLSALPVFFGSGSPAIRRAEFEPQTGALHGLREVAPLARASYLERSADGGRLYAVAEGREGTVHAFAIEPEGMLRSLGSVPSVGAAPCALGLSPDGRLLAVANYTSGSFVAYSIKADGSFGQRVAHVAFTHASHAHPNRQEAPHAHGVTWSPDGRVLLIPDLGGDRVYSFSYDAAAQTLVAFAKAPFLSLPAGAGPRVARYAPDGRHLYVLNELANTLSRFAVGSAPGEFFPLGEVSTLPADFVGENTAAELALSPDGRFVYASNRGHDSLAIFRRDPATGELSAQGHVPSPAKPRHFSLSPDGRWLLAAGQSADLVRVYAVSAEDGSLRALPGDLSLPSPQCVRF